MLSRKLTPFAAVAVAAALAIPASAGSDELSESWANVNICNGSQLGARAQLAGDGSSADMQVRFTAEWLSPTGWAPLEGAAETNVNGKGSTLVTGSCTVGG